ncbi:PIN domain-containing protein [Streptomyces sp. NPDC017413]|uniref:PIN domain-containing protein n=1 Tax=Streptomyces sp. NPDC017413 TaxID=3364994 RepID=UPI00379A7C33
MLVTPMPGTDRDHLISTLDSVKTQVDNLRGPFNGPAYGRLVRYLRWASDSARLLRNLIRPADITRLVLTQRYDALLSGASGGLAGSHQEGFLNDLVSLEMEERVADLAEAVTSLKERIKDWEGAGVLVVADSSVYIQHESKLLDWDFRSLCGVREESLHLLFPMVVIDELDNLKQSKDRTQRWRAGYTLAVLERHVTTGVGWASIKEADHSPLDAGGIPSGRVTVEVLYDPPGHSRLPINDDEIVDRAVTVQLITGRPVRLLTYDTGQAMRARAAGLQVRKLRPTAETEPEPSATK